MTTHFSTPQSNIELMRRAFSALGRKDVDACVKLMPVRFQDQHSRNALPKKRNRRVAKAR